MVIHGLFICFPLVFFIAVCQYIDMVCIYCNSPTNVTNSRKSARAASVWRRRSCNKCKNVFTTIETVDFNQTLVVISDNGDMSPFNRDRLYLSLFESCRHRPQALSEASGLTNTVLTRLLPQNTQGMLKIDDIRTTTLNVLKNFDKVAETYYRAYYCSKS